MRRPTAGQLAAFFRAALQGDTATYAYLSKVAAAPVEIVVYEK